MFVAKHGQHFYLFLPKAASTLVLAENSRECLFPFSWQFVQIRLA